MIYWTIGSPADATQCEGRRMQEEEEKEQQEEEKKKKAAEELEKVEGKGRGRREARCRGWPGGMPGSPAPISTTWTSETPAWPGGSRGV